jgi:hypothetical protein
MKESNPLDCENDIIMMGFLSPSLMILIDNQSMIWLINTSDLRIFE